MDVLIFFMLIGGTTGENPPLARKDGLVNMAG